MIVKLVLTLQMFFCQKCSYIYVASYIYHKFYNLKCRIYVASRPAAKWPKSKSTFYRSVGKSNYWFSPGQSQDLNPVWHEGMVKLSPFCNTTTLSSQIQKPEFWSFHIRYWKKFVKDVSNLASFYGSHINGIVCVKQIGLGFARTLKKN